MHKIIVTTVYNTENCGSFFQAYAMKKVLENDGHKTAFYYSPVGATTHSLKKHILSAIRSLYHGRIIAAINTISQYYTFEKLLSYFEVITHKSDFYEEADVVVLGSDTIWNFNSPNFRREVSIYWGAIFENKRVITYAASAGNTTVELFQETVNNEAIKNNIQAFLLRDRHTQKLIESLGINATQLVCDPTLLLSPNSYAPFSKKYKYSQKSLIVYCFESLSEGYIQEIKEYAKERNLTIISLLKYCGWADHNLSTSPYNMITAYSNAEAVVTDTFHGTAFSINYSLPYVVIERNKIKVREILETFNETYRLVNNPHNMIKTLEIPNSQEKDKKLSCIREYSHKLLISSIE